MYEILKALLCLINVREPFSDPSRYKIKSITNCSAREPPTERTDRNKKIIVLKRLCLIF